MFTFTDRQQLLFEWLQSQGSASIGEIKIKFRISPATAYRDARALVQAGKAVKTSNGVKLAPLPAIEDDKCFFCGSPINERLAFVFELQDGSLRKACCPHCGLMGFGKMNVVSALASDFLYGHMINVRIATFLLESSLNLCCSPSVLCFSSEADAAQFQAGFGGHIHPFEQAVEQITELMSF